MTPTLSRSGWMLDSSIGHSEPASSVAHSCHTSKEEMGEREGKLGEGGGAKMCQGNRQ